MTRNVSIQTYLPPHVAAWVQNEAARVGQSRSLWIATVIHDLFNGQELRAESRKHIEFVERRMIFIGCAIDGLLLEHPAHTLRDRVREAFRLQMEKHA